MDGLRELVARHLASADEREAEMALLLAQPPEKQRIVEERLTYIDAYARLDRPSVSDVDTAAAQLGVSRRQFYRLLAKLRTYGPVRALTPGFQNVARASAVREGLAEPIEAVLRQALSSAPDMRISKLHALVAGECKRLSLTPPTDWMLRQRVHALRSSGVQGGDGQFGSEIVIDQVSLDLAIDWLGLPRYGIFSAIVDRSTKLIIGSSILPRDGYGDGLALALKDLESRGLLWLREQHLPTAKQLRELVWIAPPGLEKLADAVASTPLNATETVVKVVSDGPRRHGEALLRLIGDRLGPYDIRARRPLDLRGGRPTDGGMPFDDAERAVRYCVDAWNKKLISNLPRENAAERLKHARRLNRIARQIADWFKPLLKQVQDQPHFRAFEDF